jgi:hypothetical protein
MENHVAFIFFVVDIDRFHESMADSGSITRENIIDMFRVQTERAVISGTAVWMKRDGFLTVLADEEFVAHDKRHLNY